MSRTPLGTRMLAKHIQACSRASSHRGAAATEGVYRGGCDGHQGVPEGQTHQLDALRKGVVLPVLLREALQDLSLAVPAPCGNKKGIRG